MRMTLLILVPLLAVLAWIKSPLSAQPAPSGSADRSPEADITSLIPSTIKQTEVELAEDDQKRFVKVQYAVKEKSIFLLPVWVVEKIERIVNGTKTECKPSDLIIPSGVEAAVQLDIVIRNLLDRPVTERLIQTQLKQYVANQQGLTEVPNFRFEKPSINEADIRFTLIGRGRGEEPEIALSTTVPSADGVLGFDIDPVAVRRCERLNTLAGGLTLANTTILATGPMKVRFERLELESQIGYLRAAAADFRKRVGSAFNPGGPSPDLIVSLQSGGSAQIQNEITSLLRQSLQVTVSTRRGATDLPLLPLLTKAFDSFIRQGQIDLNAENQRITFLMDQQVTLTATLGEVKRLAKLDEAARTKALREATDYYHASRRGEARSTSGNLQTNFLGTGGRVSGSYAERTAEENARRDTKVNEQFQEAFDKLMKTFEGNVKLPTGIHVDDQAMDASLKDLKAQFSHNTFFFDYTMHRFAPISLAGTTNLATGPNEWLRRYAQVKADDDKRLEKIEKEWQQRYTQLKADDDKRLEEWQRRYTQLQADYNALQKLVGTPQALAEAKENMNKMAKLIETVEAKIAQIETTLSKIDNTAVIQLRKELAALKSRVVLPQGPRTLKSHTGSIESVAFSPDGQRIATASWDNTARIWDAKNGQELQTLKGHTGTVYGVAFSLDGQRIATASADYTARIWDAKSGQELQTLKGHNWPINSVAFSPDGQRIATASWDNTARIWDAKNGQELQTLKGHTDSVMSVAFSPYGLAIVSGSKDTTARVWLVE